MKGDYEPPSLLHTLYKCPKAPRTTQYICIELTLQENIKGHEIILTNAKCTFNLGENLMEIKYTMNVQF